MPVRSSTDFVHIHPSSGEDGWDEKLARRLDRKVSELSQDRDVIGVATTPITDNGGETVDVFVTVVWREP
ncbi:MAG TPA: hypothetical protein VLJ80_05890 [Solirubrobacteraceae bacterium]|nr:hypothetical protein [Solirubrobacteraceae bacterium]